METVDEIKRIRICRVCGIVDVEEKFRRDGHKTICNTCKKCDAKNAMAYRAEHPEQCKEAQKRWREQNKGTKKVAYKAWRAKNPDKLKAAMKRAYWSRYNITEDFYRNMLVAQENKCAICHHEFSNETRYYTPHIDHNHACCSTAGVSCGKCIRGLLCGPCNQFLGRIKDSIETIERALKYLKEK
jgi:hypothetical protein